MDSSSESTQSDNLGFFISSRDMGNLPHLSDSDEENLHTNSDSDGGGSDGIPSSVHGDDGLYGAGLVQGFSELTRDNIESTPNPSELTHFDKSTTHDFVEGSEAEESEGIGNPLDDCVSSIKESKLESLKEIYPFLSNRDLKVPSSSESIRSPPEGYYALYLEYLKFGLSLPLDKEFGAILAGFNLALVQLSPKSVAILVSLRNVCARINLPFSWDWIRRLYRLQAIKNCSDEFTMYSVIKKLEFVTKFPSNFGPWRKEFFFVKYDPDVDHFEIPDWKYAGVQKSVKKGLQLKVSDCVVQRLIPHCVNPSAFVECEGMSGLIGDVKVRRYETTKKRDEAGPSVTGGEKGGKTTPIKESERKRKSEETRVGEKDDPKRVKIAVAGGAITEGELPEGSLAHSLKDLPMKEAFLAVADMMRFVAGKATGGPDEKLRKELVDAKRQVEKLTSDNKKLQRQLKTYRANGPLSPEYPSAVMDRVMKTKDFERLFAAVSAQARQLGQCEGLKAQVVANPELVDHGLPSPSVLDRDIAEDKRSLKKLFLDSVRDGGHRFALLEHLKGLPYLPDVEQLKSLDVDFNEELPEEMRPIPVRKSSRDKKEKPKSPTGDGTVPTVGGDEAAKTSEEVAAKTTEEAATEVDKDATNDNVSSP